ncbi:SusC/RagA family TonB-linked outer membrane protein [Niastella koreensis]|uniref:TonB-dependent receptor plug n=2 Tax=Niastella koreensis TaxID=354356 RepID=G8TM27_NIAKG|nr:TonB-dependent receptor [Niastella koreensis]AEV99800.1 TonB-dependent receptor plug [Niastella koreensis GR20-10]OQP51580.1 SusC/RagA family TonB-linked outer membrane protein [Niastella koreensis]
MDLEIHSVIRMESPGRSRTTKTLQIMKLTAILLLATCLQVCANGYAQKVSLSEKNAPLEKVIQQIKKQTGYQFWYEDKLLQKARPVSISVQNEPLDVALKKVFTNQPFTYEVIGKTVAIKEIESTTPETKPELANTPLPVDITGRVLNEQGEPLAKASVSLPGGRGTQTDADGVFLLKEVLPDDIITITYTGYEPQKVRIGDRTFFAVVMKLAEKGLDETVVVAYGKQKKISVTGSVTSVNMQDMRTPVRSLTNALAGKVAGIISMQTGGEPGYDNPTFTIRGIGTFTGGTSPLIIIDGVQRDDVNSTFGGAYNNIDPEDVASISLLKDASATAVYGARGANGVLIITTRKGVAGKPKISMKMESGMTGLTKTPKMLDGVTYMKLLNEAKTNMGETPAYSDDVIQKTASGLDPYLYPNVNWIKTIYKNWAPLYNGNVNVSGGGEAMRYYMSASFYDQDGSYKVTRVNGYNPNLNFKRYDFRSNVDVNVTKTTLLSLNLDAMLVNSRYPGNSASSIWYAAYATNPTAFPVSYPGDKWAGPRNNGGSNPFNLVQNSGYSTEFRPTIQSIISLNQRLDGVTKGLAAMTRFSFDSYGQFDNNRTGTNDLWYTGSRDGSGNLVYEHVRTGNQFLGYSSSSTGERVMYLEGNITYDRSFGAHSFGGLLLYNMRNRVTGTASSVKYAIPYRNQSFASRITYSYNDKYLAELNAGYTGSENFKKGERFGFFPAVSVGWVISRESFFDPLAGTVNLLKVRASHGVTGNDQIGYGDRFGYLTYISGGNTTAFGLGPSYYSGITESVFGVENLRWEKSTKDNLGIEVGLLNKINIVADVFRDKRKDILILRQSISSVGGYSLSSIYANMGEMQNKGVDGSIEYNDKFGKNVRLRLFGNFTYAKNKIIYADQPKRTNAYQQWEGHRFGEFTGYSSQGLFVDQNDIDKSAEQKLGSALIQPGDIKYRDLNGDGTVDANDWSYLDKSSFPALLYGLGFTVGVKRFDISIFLQGVSDVGIMANGSGIAGINGAAGGVGIVPFAGIGQYPGNVLSNVTSRWTKDNPVQNVDYPRLSVSNQSSNNYQNSTWWLKDGSFCRLKQASIGYDLGIPSLKRAGIASLYFYAAAQNLFTFSKFKLWDPELGSSGATYPPARTITVGVRAQF